MRLTLLFSAVMLVFIGAMTAQVFAEKMSVQPDDKVAAAPADSIAIDTVSTDTLAHDPTRLNDDDYRRAADSIGCEVAAINAVVDCEAGPTHRGFWEEGKPIANFDLSVYRKFCRKRGINPSAYKRLYKPAPKGQPNVWAKLEAAMEIDRQSAIEGTFWGMFQIGGFNWSKCGCGDIEEFYSRMCKSEGEQLMLFVAFIRTTDIDRHLRAHNWAAFSRSYNGPNYAAQGYHTRMASSFARHSKESK